MLDSRFHTSDQGLKKITGKMLGDRYGDAIAHEAVGLVVVLWENVLVREAHQAGGLAG
jgi:hypothetical protein